jgi:hypothetical protein
VSEKKSGYARARERTILALNMAYWCHNVMVRCKWYSVIDATENMQNAAPQALHRISCHHMSLVGKTAARTAYCASHFKFFHALHGSRLSGRMALRGLFIMVPGAVVAVM